MIKNILLTGASGFVGSALKEQLTATQKKVIPVYRNESSDGLRIENIDAYSDWSEVFSKDISHVIHTAARVHVMNDSASDPLEEFRKVNTYGTLNLAKQAAQAGVKRFIFLSSIKVNGEFTEIGKPFLPSDKCSLTDPYGISKFEAEQGLLELSESTDMEVVIIRPPLVYGPGVKANFESMIKWVSRGVPLPFGSVRNSRSLVALNNLVSFCITCLEHPNAANEIFLISDNTDVSTTELLKKIANSMGKKPLLLPVPVKFMEFCAKIIGKKDLSQRVFGNLQVDDSKARELLQWTNSISIDNALRLTTEHFLHEKNI